MNKCNICGITKSKSWLGCLGGWTLCMDCEKDWSAFKIQPERDDNITMLMEVYFRRGKGETITYEQLHREKSNYKFLTFMELFKPQWKKKKKKVKK